MAEANKKSDVVLVWPPVAPANAPAFGLSILKAALKDGEMYLALPVELSLSDYMTKYLLHQPVVDQGRL